MNRKVLEMGATGSVSSPNSKRGNRVLGTLTFKGVQHLEKADSSLRREMEVMCSVLKRSVTSVSLITMESADRALMSTSVLER